MRGIRFHALLHELATNAAKYGALSGAPGRLAITWSVSDGRLTVDWQESDGPEVSPSDAAGFGSRLLGRALDQFGGTIVRKFEQTGLVCKMSLNLPPISDIGTPTAGSEGAIPDLGERKGTTNAALEMVFAQRQA